MIAHFGMTTAFLSIAMNGTVTCTATNHPGENFGRCALHIPNGMLAYSSQYPVSILVKAIPYLGDRSDAVRHLKEAHGWSSITKT